MATSQVQLVAVGPSQASYKQGSKWLVESASKDENMDNITLHIYALLLVQIRRTLPLVLVGFLFFFQAFELWVKDAAGTIDHALIA